MKSSPTHSPGRTASPLMHAPLPKRNAISSSLSLNKQVLLNKEKTLMESHHHSPKSPTVLSSPLSSHQLQTFENNFQEIFMKSPSSALSSSSSSLTSLTMVSSSGSLNSDFVSSPTKSKLSFEILHQLSHNENCIVMEKFEKNQEWFQLKMLPDELDFKECKEGSVYSMKLLLYLDCRREGILLEQKEWIAKIELENSLQMFSIQNNLYHSQVQICFGQIASTSLNRIYLEILLSSDAFQKFEEEWLLIDEATVNEPILQFQNEIVMHIHMNETTQRVTIPIAATFIGAKFYEKEFQFEQFRNGTNKTLVGTNYKNYFVRQITQSSSLETTNPNNKHYLYFPTNYTVFEEDELSDEQQSDEYGLEEEAELHSSAKC